MALQLSVSARVDMADALSAFIGAAGTMKLFSGAVPANCAAADPSGELANGTLPAVPFIEADGVLTAASNWTATGTAAGNAASFRIYENGNCAMQGNVTASGGGGVMELSSVTIAVDQTVSITSVTITVGGA